MDSINLRNLPLVESLKFTPNGLATVSSSAVANGNAIIAMNPQQTHMWIAKENNIICVNSPDYLAINTHWQSLNKAKFVAGIRDLQTLIPTTINKGRFRVTGLLFTDDRLVVNFVDRYDTVDRPESIMVFESPYDLDKQKVSGPFVRNHARRINGLMCHVPEYLQPFIGGDALSVKMTASIYRHMDTGPSVQPCKLKYLPKGKYTLDSMPTIGQFSPQRYKHTERNVPIEHFYDHEEYKHIPVADRTRSKFFHEAIEVNRPLKKPDGTTTKNTWFNIESFIRSVFIVKDSRTLITINDCIGATGSGRFREYKNCPIDVATPIVYKGNKFWNRYDNLREYRLEQLDPKNPNRVRDGYSQFIRDDVRFNVMYWDLANWQHVKEGKLHPSRVSPYKVDYFYDDWGFATRTGSSTISSTHYNAEQQELIAACPNVAGEGRFNRCPLFVKFDLAVSY